MITETVPDMTKYTFWSGVAAAAAASVSCRCVHDVAEFVEADGRTAHRAPLNIDR